MALDIDSIERKNKKRKIDEAKEMMQLKSKNEKLEYMIKVASISSDESQIEKYIVPKLKKITFFIKIRLCSKYIYEILVFTLKKHPLIFLQKNIAEYLYFKIGNL